MNDDAQRQWDLWHLRTLFPAWGESERAALVRAGREIDARQQRLFASPRGARDRFAAAARRVLADHPDLASGLVVSLHLGPYALVPAPWLLAGRDVHVLLNGASLAGVKPVADDLHRRLGLPGRVRWVPLHEGGFALRLARVLRRGGTVLAFLDGNDGSDGPAGTLRAGIPFDLPGRRIRVRTGLARLALRLGCPVHALVTLDDPHDGFRWERGPTRRWPAGTCPDAATRELFGWAFDLIARHPAQWRAWNMLTGVCDSFRPAAPDAAAAAAARAAAVLAPDRRDTLLVWRRAVRIWPGDMLEDVAGHCFYAACGLTTADLGRIARCAPLTPARLAEGLGTAWVRRHLPRLVALGVVDFAPADERDARGAVAPAPQRPIPC